MPQNEVTLTPRLLEQIESLRNEFGKNDSLADLGYITPWSSLETT